MGLRRKARECALQMLFAADVSEVRGDDLVRYYWNEISDAADVDDAAREFATRLAIGTLSNLETVDERIRSRAEHWRIERMAIVDRNVLRLAVYEFLFEPTPHTVAINEALEIARRFSTYEATQFINGILDAIKHDLQKENPDREEIEEPAEETASTDESSDEETEDSEEEMSVMPVDESSDEEMSVPPAVEGGSSDEKEKEEANERSA